MQPDARWDQTECKVSRMCAVQAHPLAELLACPQASGNLLTGEAKCIQVEAGDAVFRQSGACRGLYILVAGQFLRRAERLESRVALGTARAGELVELAAALGDGRHTYTLSAQTDGSVLLLPMGALRLAFENYPPLRMQLLEELAREVSRGYDASCLCRLPRTRRKLITGSSSSAGR